MAIPPLILRIYADTTGMQRGVAQANAQVGGLRASVLAHSALIQAGVIAAGAAVVKFGIDAVGAARDFTESANKVNVVFDEGADQVVKWSETMASSFGIAQGDALEMAGTFGNLFDAMGLAEKAGTDMSMTLVELSADLASFNNASPEDVLKAMQSGLVGQIRPLRQYGVEISQAALQQEALAQGITKSVLQMTMAEKVQLRYALILKQTTNAQGDFARTSDELANQQRILAAQWEDLQVAVGLLLLPAVKDLVSAMNDLATVMIFVVNGFEDFDAKVKESTTNVVDFELGLGGTISKFLTGNPIIKSAADIWGAFTGSQNEAAESTSHVQSQLDNLKKGVAKTGDEISDFAGMTVKDFNAWRTDSIANLNGVSGSLEELAKQANLTAQDILKSFRMQLKAMAEYQNNWETLLKRGLPDSLAQQLQEMGLEGAGIVAALANANKERFNAIINDWQKAQREAAETANAINGIGTSINSLPKNTTLSVQTIFTREGSFQGRQHGGPVSAMRPYIVGERGPELFVPGTSGTIVPNGGGGGGDIYLQVDGQTFARISRDELLKLKGSRVSLGLS